MIPLTLDVLVALTGATPHQARAWLRGARCPSWDVIHTLAPHLDDVALGALVERAVVAYGPCYHTSGGVAYADLPTTYGHEAEQAEIAAALGVSPQRVSVLIEGALALLAGVGKKDDPT